MKSEARKLLEQATPLPWEAGQTGPEQSYIYRGAGHIGGVGTVTHADAELVVYAVNRLPEYEAAVDALAELLAELRPKFGQHELSGYETHSPVAVYAADAALRRLRGEARGTE